MFIINIISFANCSNKTTKVPNSLNVLVDHLCPGINKIQTDVVVAVGVIGVIGVIGVVDGVGVGCLVLIIVHVDVSIPQCGIIEIH